MDYAGIVAGVAVIHFFAVSSPGPTLFVVWSVFAAAGLGAAIAAIPWLPVAIRILGGAYLAWFGWKMLRSAWKGGASLDLEAQADGLTRLAALRSGFITNISNPKVIAYYVSLFGVMVPPDSPPVLFAVACLTAVVVSALWWGAVSVFFRLPVVRRGFLRIRRVFDGIVGAALVGFGIKLIAAR